MSDHDHQEENEVIDLIEVDDSDDNLPLLEIIEANLPASAYALRHELANSALVFDRGRLLVRLATDAHGLLYAQPLTPHLVAVLAHEVCQPFKYKEKKRVMTTLPDRVARMYLDLGEWQARPLAGITAAPIMREDGTLMGAAGYDAASEIYSSCAIKVPVPEKPTRQEALEALQVLRRAFRTFPFADAELVPDDKLGVDVVDLEQSPGLYESSFLAALLTTVARPALWTAPGVMIVAPQLSGAGAGKGLLVRAMTTIAYGYAPEAQTFGHDKNEFDKRLVGSLIAGAAVIFIDNINDTLLRSDSLASALTERPAQVRVLGGSKMVPLNCAAMVMLTGNGLSVTEDLARRFLWIIIDPRMEDPENRPFKRGFLGNIKRRRQVLLTAALTILRYGRVNKGKLTRGLAMGSFEQWSEWVRDPLVDLGCKDPVEASRQAKAADPKRRETAELFAEWHKVHRGRAVAVKDLDDEVLALLNPDGQPRQWVTRKLQRMLGVRYAGYILSEVRGGVHSPLKFALHGDGMQKGAFEIVADDVNDEDAAREEGGQTPPETPVNPGQDSRLPTRPRKVAKSLKSGEGTSPKGGDAVSRSETNFATGDYPVSGGFPAKTGKVAGVSMHDAVLHNVRRSKLRCLKSRSRFKRRT